MTARISHPSDQAAGRPGRSEDGLKSLGKVMQILQVFSTANRSLPLAAICDLTSFPKGTAHRLLSSMCEVGLLERERDRYRLGIRLLELGNIVLANMDLHREARPYIDALTRQAGQTTHLAVFDGTRAVVIHRGETSPDKPLAPPLIEQAPVHCTSVGKAILAFQDEATIERVIRAGLRRFTAATITQPERLREALAAIRTCGFAVDEGEHQPGTRCIGAPIREPSGRVIAGLSVTAPTWRLPATEVGALAKVVTYHADAISAALASRR